MAWFNKELRYIEVYQNILKISQYEATRRKCISQLADLLRKHKDELAYASGGRSRWRIENETFNTLKNQD